MRKLWSAVPVWAVSLASVAMMAVHEYEGGDWALWATFLGLSASALVAAKVLQRNRLLGMLHMATVWVAVWLLGVFIVQDLLGVFGGGWNHRGLALLGLMASGASFFGLIVAVPEVVLGASRRELERLESRVKTARQAAAEIHALKTLDEEQLAGLARMLRERKYVDYLVGFGVGIMASVVAQGLWTAVTGL